MSGPTEEQTKKMYDGLSDEQKSKQTYTEWVKAGYNNQHDKWMPWIEDKYLSMFTHDNKASYATKGTGLQASSDSSSLEDLLLIRDLDALDNSKVTGISQVDNLQDGANNLAAGQVGQDGLLAPVGNMASKDGINRAERGGKDDKGSYGGPMADKAMGAGEGIAGGAQSAGSTVTEGAKGTGGYISSMFGGGEKK